MGARGSRPAGYTNPEDGEGTELPQPVVTPRTDKVRLVVDANTLN